MTAWIDVALPVVENGVLGALVLAVVLGSFVRTPQYRSKIVAGFGGTVSLGFNGTDTGLDPAPTAFFINGTVCANN